MAEPFLQKFSSCKITYAVVSVNTLCHTHKKGVPKYAFLYGVLKSRTVYFTILMKHFGSAIGRLKRGAEDAYSFMNTGRISELRIPVPPLTLQRRFAALVAEHERLRAMQREALRQAEHLFQTLLHDAFADGAA